MRLKRFYQASSEIFEVNAEGSFNRTTTGNNVAGFEASLDDTEGIVNRSFDFISHQVVSTSDEDGAGSSLSETLMKCKKRETIEQIYFNEAVIPITDGFFKDGFSGTEPRGVKDFFTFRISKGGDDGSSGGLGDSSKISLVNSSHGEDTSFNEVLGGDIIDSLGGDDDIGTSLDKLFTSFLQDVAFSG